jgi:class 3 adenylate cyclase
MTGRSTSTERARGGAAWVVVLALPLAGLGLLLARPELDVEWKHEPSHFWLVLATALVSLALGFVTHLAASRHRDARLVLMSLAFIASAGFLGLHALATPGVLLPGPNVGFVVATPVGLGIGAVFAAISTSPLGGPGAARVLRRRTLLLWGLVAVMVAWAIASLAALPPLDGPPPAAEAVGLLSGLAIVAVALYGLAAVRSVQLHRARGGAVVLSIAVACVLLAEAMIAVALSRNWHASWWEWHLLLLAAFAAIAVGAREEYRRSGSLVGAFGGIYLEATLARIDRWHADAIAAVASADAHGVPPDAILRELRREGATTEEVALLRNAAGELRRLDDLFRPYLPAHVAERLRADPGVADLGGQERDVSVLFADLSGFTTFSERRPPAEVIAMLNEQWATAVPVIDAAGGIVEQFAGDGVMVTFNVLGDQPDHARRAGEAALDVIAAGRDLLGEHPGWPLFRAGVNTGRAVVGNVGVAGRRSFAVIGDTTNVAARLMAAGDAGEATVAEATWDAIDGERGGADLGPLRLKGKRDAVRAWRLRSVGPAAR